jgi:ferrous iron transport protein B
VLVIPFMSCSARLPVYTLLVGVLFANRPLYAGLAFTGCYVLGALAALLSAMLFRRSVLKGPSRPMVLELPTYKLPSLRTALVTTLDRGWIFLRKAGTVILAICIVLWWLSSFPKAGDPAAAESLRLEAEAIVAQQPEQAEALDRRADELASRHAVAQSFAGRIGRTIEPVFRPIGLDWQLSIGVVTSFAAREVFVSTLAVLFTGGDGDEEGVLKRIRTAERDDGSPVFTMATAAALLVFYVLAIQCLPTLAVTARETGHWGWALLQLGYMSVLAYVCAFFVHVSLTAAGVG